MDRKEHLLRHVDKSRVGLEVGPYHNPIAPKVEGYNVEIIDHASKEELIKKLGNQPLDASKIEHVDYIWRGEKLTDLVGKTNHYNWIIASHIVEHIPDLITFLQECEKLLEGDGSLILAVPDKRYSFDYFRGISTTGQLINNNIDQRIDQKLGDIFDHFSLASKKRECITWVKDEAAPPQFVHSFEYALEQVELAKKTGEYTDVHMWQFTPSSFRLIIQDLNRLGFINLKEIDFISNDDFEFFITLGRQGKGCPLSRLELAVKTQEELARSVHLHEEIQLDKVASKAKMPGFFKKLIEVARPHV